MAEIELVLRALTSFQFVLLAAVFARAGRGDHLAPVGVALCASLVAFVITSARDAEEWLGLLWLPLSALCATKAVWLWLLARAVFADRFIVASRDVGLLALTTALALAYEIAPDGSLNATLTLLLLGGLTLAVVVLVPIGLWQQQRDDLDEHRRAIRSWILPFAAIYLGAVGLWQTFVFIEKITAPAAMVWFNLAVMFTASLCAILALVRVRSLEWARTTPPPPGADELSPTQRAVLGRLRAFVASPRWFARADLSMPGLARHLATNEQTLRAVMRHAFNFRNFNDWLHYHRLAEAAMRLKEDPDASVLTIALDAGYGSIGPFNRAFKAAHGVTPTQFRAQAGTLNAELRLDSPAPAARHA